MGEKDVFGILIPETLPESGNFISQTTDSIVYKYYIILTKETAMEKIRLQKFLSQSGVASRRRAEELIEAGSVTINGRPAGLGMSVDPSRDIVAVDGVRVQQNEGFRYIMLYKPRGYVTTMSDEKGRRCVADLIADVPGRVYPIGRLDRDSEGLLLLTDDGELANQLMHPRYHMPKVYRATLRPDFTEENALQLLQGIVLDGEKCQPVPSRVIVKEPNRAVVELVLHEGKNRQIRRMCEQLGLEVARLRRTSIGPVRLGMLAPGKWRELEKAELAALRREIQKAISRAESGQSPEPYVWPDEEPADENDEIPVRERRDGGRKSDSGERSSHGERKPYSGERSSHGERKPYSGERSSHGERRPYSGERSSHGERRPYSGERSSHGERRPYSGERSSHGERKPYSGERSSHGERKPYSGERSSHGERRPYSGERSSHGERRPYSGERSSHGERRPNPGAGKHDTYRTR